MVTPFAVLLLVLCAAVMVFSYKKGFDKQRLLSMGLFLVSLLCAFLLQSKAPVPLTNQFLPFYKIVNISQYGYQGILNDLLTYALIFVPAGLFISLTFPACSILLSFGLGIVLSLFFFLPSFFSGASFVSDIFMLGGLGMASGTALLQVLSHLFSKQSWFDSSAFVKPDKKNYYASLSLLGVVYFGIAFIMIADFGSKYGTLSFYQNDVPIPVVMDSNQPLESDIKKAPIYGTDTSGAGSVAKRTAEAFLLQGDLVMTDSSYVLSGEDGYILTVDSDTAWTYEYQHTWNLAGQVPSVQEAETIAREFFASHDVLLGFSLGKLIDATVNTNEHLLGPFDPQGPYTQEMYNALLEEAKKPVSVELFFRLRVGAYDIVSSNEISVTVGLGGRITRIKKNDPFPVAVANKSIVSPKEAFDRYLSGEGMHTLYQPLQNAVLQSFSLCYMLEPRGNYLPAWQFHLTGVNENGETVEFEAYAAALK